MIGGWAGKVLRVDLTERRVWTEDTLERYRDVIGGTGIGYRVLWDEVPAGVGAWDPQNRIVFATGPLAGTRALCSGRTAITSLWPLHPRELVGSGHMGGHFAPELKYAGYDAVVVQGRSEAPVWLRIVDGAATIEDAAHLWGQGVYRTTAEIAREIGARAQVAAIGPAGENRVRMSCIITGGSHCAGGLGSVMGAKGLKAIGVVGRGGVRIAADPDAWQALIHHALTLTGANNQWVVPSTPQPWAEYHDPRSRWTADPSRSWGAADPPVVTGTCDPDDLHSIGLRTHKGIYDFGEFAQDYTVRMDGCHACPVRCFEVMRVPSATRFGVPAEAANTCWGWWGGQLLAPWGDAELPRLEAAVVGKHLADDLGVWSNYSLLVKTFAFAQQHGLLEQHLGVDEFASIPWDHFEAKDPRFVADVIRRIAHAEGELGQTLGGRTADWVRDWSFPDAYFQSFRIGYFKDGHPRHHSVTSGGQVGLLVNTQYNRDAQCHSHSSFLRCGLPHEVIREIAGEVFGSPEAVDERDALTRTNPAKARFAKWAVLRKELHDSVALCNWMFPFLVSPRKDRDYRGDSGLEAKLFSAVTGIETSEQELDQAAERIFNLHRALTFRGLGEPDLRAHHDVLPPWVFHDDQDRAPYTPGSRAMEREDMDLALTQFYEACGWDPQTGAPTRKTLRGLGLGDVADGLAQAKLI